MPGLLEWPGGISQPRVIDTPVVTSDFFPTFVDLAGGKLPARPYDGISLVPLLKGEANSFDRNICFSTRGWLAIQNERYKLVRPKGKTSSFELYDMEGDPHKNQKHLCRPSRSYQGTPRDARSIDHRNAKRAKMERTTSRKKSMLNKSCLGWIGMVALVAGASLPWFAQDAGRAKPSSAESSAENLTDRTIGAAMVDLDRFGVAPPKALRWPVATAKSGEQPRFSTAPVGR